MKNILARGGIEFLAVFLGIALSLWVDEYQKSKDAKNLNNQILNRLYDNLEADSIDAEWNYKAHKFAFDSGDLIYNWCVDGQPENDSISLYLSRLAIVTTLVNNEEEYNALKSSGRMELLNNADIVRTLHDYYTWIRYVKNSEVNVINISINQFLPFMSKYSEYYGVDSTTNVYSNAYPLFRLHQNPPKKELSYYASFIGTYANYSSNLYTGLLTRVVELRRMIRIELSS